MAKKSDQEDAWIKWRGRTTRHDDDPDKPISPGTARSAPKREPTQFSAPDWTVWRLISTAKLWECVALGVGIDPAATAGLNHYERLSDEEVEHSARHGDERPRLAKEYLRRLKVACANVKEIAGISLVLGPEQIIDVSVGRYVSWMREHAPEFNLPAELGAFPSPAGESSAPPKNAVAPQKPSQAPILELRVARLVQFLDKHKVPAWERKQLRRWTLAQLHLELQQYPEFAAIEFSSFKRHFWRKQDVAKLPDPSKKTGDKLGVTTGG